MVKNTATISTFDPALPLAGDGSSTMTSLVNTPRDIQYDVRIEFTLDAGTITGNIVVELVSVNADSTEFLPADSDDNRTITLLSDTFTADSTITAAKGIDRVAGISNLMFKITNDSGVSITVGEITLGKLQF
jgi:hypothetical protein